ncbi:uncharacterized protein LOC133912427 [Phragmites australis]|uniref:uncharacterized protein LOC133912427 n=1 Tax=Phragmites australis TaxID=29695 RepID=UPI002D7920CB|nr:uncharacterized protein LOC133912427 [Phragmites australis]
MVVSLRLSRRGRRLYPPPPPASTHAVDDPPRPHAAASLDGPPPPPRPPWEVAGSWLHSGIAARSELPHRNEVVPLESDIEPSFALNLYPDGYSIGELGKGMFLYLIGDDPKKRPYSRASKALFSDIEYGCLPQDILHGIPCKFQNGSTVCEVWDYRSFFSNGGDDSGDDFPKVNRVLLRMGTECVVKDLSSIADASWTYHDQLIAESTILNALQPRLNLDPTPCLEKLCNSSVKKIDLDLYKGRQNTKGTSLLKMSINPPENCMPKEFNVCEGAAVCIENAAREGMPSGTLNSSSVNSPSTIHVNNAQSAVESDTENTIRSSSTLMNSSALCDRKQSASNTSPDHLHQSNEQQACAAILQVDREKGQPQRLTVLPQNRKKSSNPLHERHESKKGSPPNKTARSSSRNSKGLQKSTGTSNKEGLQLGSPNELQVEVKVDRTIGNKDMKAQKQFPLSVLPSTHSCTSLNTSNPCIDKIPEKVNSLHIMLKEHHEAPIVDPKKSGTADLKDSRTPSVASFNASSRNATCEPCEDNAATEPQCTASKRNVSGISTSFNQEINLKGKGWQKVDTQIKPPCENRSSEEPVVTGGVSSQLGISSYLESCSGHPINTSEPGIEKILSEVILTTQRHGLNEKAAKSYGLETSWLLPPSEFFQSQNAEEIPYMREETMPYYATKGATSTWKIRRLTFHPSKYLFCNGLVDESHYTLCLLESQAPDNHQITVGTIYGDEHTHIATLPTSCHAEKFVDQFISLMKRDGYNLCNDKVCNESSELRQQFEEVPNLGYLTGEYAEYLMCSPSVESSLAFNENNDVGCTFQNRLPDYHANLLQSLTQQWVVTEQSPTMETPEAFFLNPSHPDGLQYSSRILHDQGPLFACNSFAMDLHQFPSVQPSQEVSMDQCLQCRHDIPGFSDTCGVGTSATSYGQWRQVYTQMGNVVYQWDLPALGRQIHSSPRLHDGRSIPWSELQQIWRPHTSARSMDSDDVSVTSTPVLVQLPIPLGYQYLWNGSC